MGGNITGKCYKLKESLLQICYYQATQTLNKKKIIKNKEGYHKTDPIH